MSGKFTQNGYTLIEMVMVIIIIGILAAIAFRYLGTTMDAARTEETLAEMEQLAHAIAGNPALVSGGSRADFGYVGDVGSLPPDWNALVTDPGYATWNGPYVSDDFGSGSSDYEYMRDAWGKPYSAPNGNTFSSTGGPETISRYLAGSVADLLFNNVVVSIEDIDNSPPGSLMDDSVQLILTYPDGSGGMASRITNPDGSGIARFDSIPIGIHTLRLIYLPENDTLRRRIAVNPDRTTYVDMHYYSDVW